MDKVEKYGICISKYGFIAVCALLQEYESKEQYEECDIIYKAMQKYNDTSRNKMPTTYEGCISMLKSKYHEREYTLMLQEVGEDVRLIKKYMRPIKDS